MALRAIAAAEEELVSLKLAPAAEWASQCFFTARSEYRQERVPAGANQSLVVINIQ